MACEVTVFRVVSVPRAQHPDGADGHVPIHSGAARAGGHLHPSVVAHPPSTHSQPSWRRGGRRRAGGGPNDESAVRHEAQWALGRRLMTVKVCPPTARALRAAAALARR